MQSTFAAALEAMAGLALLCLGGEALVRGAAALALRTGLTPLAVGLTVVAFGTSTPELVVSLDAAVGGVSDIAVGNVVGSNIANILLILGFSILIRPAAVESKVIRFDAPLMVAVTGAFLLMGLDAMISRAEGLLLLVGLVAYTGWTLRQARTETKSVRQEFEAAAPPPASSWRHVLFIVVGLGALVAGGHLLVSAAVQLAIAAGVSEAVVGLTIVALGTSLPELATSVVAALKGQGDIAVGNVVGSNLFNLLGILGVTATVIPLGFGGIGWGSLLVMLAAAAILMPLLYTGTKLTRYEGAALLVGYMAFLVWLVG